MKKTLFMLASITLFLICGVNCQQGGDNVEGYSGNAQNNGQGSIRSIIEEYGPGIYAELLTSKGLVIIRFFPDEAPVTVNNFIGLAEGSNEWTDADTGETVQKPFFNGLTFHRVIPDFMIQGGCPLGNGRGGPGYRFQDEFSDNLRFDKPGLLAMANSGPNTNGSQFFITLNPTPWLNNRHTIFGEVIKGMEVVENIAHVNRDRNDRPTEPIIIEDVIIHHNEKTSFLPEKEFTLHPENTEYLGGIVRGPQNEKKLSLVFTGGSFAQDGKFILDTFKEYDIKGSFFFTGDFFREPDFEGFINRIVEEGHYISIHSDQHLLYCSWEDRSETLISRETFEKDIINNFKELERFEVSAKDARFWIPPYEWYNEEIARWSSEMGLILINMTHGTLSHADYTQDKADNFRSNEEIWESIITREQEDGLEGFLLLTHVGASEERSERFVAEYLTDLIEYLKEQGYTFARVNELLTLRGCRVLDAE